jgi:hypothetical protein
LRRAAAEVSDLSHAQVRQAAESGDQESFRQFFSDLRGERVGRSGRVVEVKQEHGDDYAEIHTLLVDLDGEQGGTIDGDASGSPPPWPRRWTPGARLS